MTYREFAQAIREIGDNVHHLIRESQVVNLDDEINPGDTDDTIFFELTDALAELINNVTGVHGHTVEIHRRK